jgi:hypothetical protein
MFTSNDLRALLDTQPFVPFRLWLSDGGFVDVCSREFVLVLKRFAIIGIPDAETAGKALDRYVTVWYFHISRHEMLNPGAPPFSPPPGPTTSPSPTSA